MKDELEPFFGTATIEVTLSSVESGKTFMMDLPLVARFPSGTSYIFVRYTLPRSVKKRMESWVEPSKNLVTKSSSLVERSTTPTPPLFCFLYSDGLVRFT